MFSLGDSNIYYLNRTATDMRKGFDEVRCGMGRDPLSGEVFIFYNASRTRLKLLHWERGGFIIYHKRFELTAFNSDNTKHLTVEETKDKIAALEYIQNELNRIVNLTK